MAKKIIKIIGIALTTIILLFAGLVGWALYPRGNPQPLPASLVASTSSEGMQRLRDADAFADYELLRNSYQPQTLASFCGVATSVSVLGAFGIQASQSRFFTDEASRVRSRFSVIFGGMSLPELAGLLSAYGLQTSVNHADLFSVGELREVVETNLATEGDYLIVNYEREVLGQGKVGHISPLSAYDRDTDSVLIMDTAAHKYPHTWVPLEMLYAAMRTKDAASGKMRGYLEVSRQ